MYKLILSGFIIIFTNICFAQSLYVTDKISIAIYPEANATGTPIKKIPSGTLVNTVSDAKLSNESKFIAIETTDGVSGWIEAKYLSNEKPTQIEYLQLAAKFNAAEAKIADYETRLLDMQQLRKEVKTTDWLRNQLSENKKREDAFEQQIKLKDIELADLRITVARLEEQLSGTATGDKNNQRGDSTKTQHSFNSNLEDDSGSFANSSSIRFYTWLVLSLAVTLIIGILLGFVLIDYKHRKKSSYAKEY